MKNEQRKIGIILYVAILTAVLAFTSTEFKIYDLETEYTNVDNESLTYNQTFTATRNMTAVEAFYLGFTNCKKLRKNLGDDLEITSCKIKHDIPYLLENKPEEKPVKENKVENTI